MYKAREPLDNTLLEYIASEIFMPVSRDIIKRNAARLGRHVLVNYKLIVIFWYHNDASKLDSNLNVPVEIRADNLAAACGLAINVSEPEARHLVVEIELIP